MTTELMKQRQERFCQEILKGSNQSNAYRVANPLSKCWKPDTIKNKASKMMALPKVKERIRLLSDHLSNKVLDEIVYTKVQHFNELKEERTFSKKQNNPSSSLKATELKGKLAGHYDPEQTPQEAKFNITQNQLIVNFIGVKK